MTTLRLVILAVIVTLVVAACGGDSAGDTTTTAAAPATTQPDDATTTSDGGGGTANVSIADFAFSGPSEVAAGTTLTITNNDGVSHTFTAEDDSFDTGAISGGQSAEVTLDELGEYAYFCNFHPQMTGTITVTG